MLDTRGSYLGSGRQYLEDLDSPMGLQEVGNCSALNYEATVNDIVQRDYTEPGGGNAATVKRVDTVAVNYTAHDYNIANIARATNGTATRVDSGTVTGEAHKVFGGGLVLLANPGATNVVIKAGAVTWVEGEDYVIGAAGLPTILEEGKVAENGTDITVDYSHGAHFDIQGYVSSGRRYRHVFVGLNEADTGRPVIIELYKMVNSPATLSMIGDEFGNMEFSGSLEKDVTKKGQGVSQYLNIKYVD